MSSLTVGLDDLYKASKYFPADDLTLLRQSSDCFKDFDLIENIDVGDEYVGSCSTEENSKETCDNSTEGILVPGALLVHDKTLNVYYTIKGVDESEFPVIGTYVDGQITPGFRYRVRYCGSGKDMFTEAKYLESIGIGYGKRITFKGDTLNNNENYFWSDSDPSGYAFSHEALAVGDKFSFVSQSGMQAGLATVTSVTRGQQELSSHVINDNTVKKIKIYFTCSLKLDTKNMSHRHVSFVSNVNFEGTALLMKRKSSRSATVQCIECIRDRFNQKFTLFAI